MSIPSKARIAEMREYIETHAMGMPVVCTMLTIALDAVEALQAVLAEEQAKRVRAEAEIESARGAMSPHWHRGVLENGPIDHIAAGLVNDYEGSLTVERGKRVAAEDIANLAMRRELEMLGEHEEGAACGCVRCTVKRLREENEHYRETRDAAIQHAEKAEREREELARRLGLYRPENPCRCGSGAHPRQCERHPWTFDMHIAEINFETLHEENVELEKERDDLRAKLDAAKLDLEVSVEVEQATAARLAACVAALEIVADHVDPGKEWTHPVLEALAAAKGGAT